MISFHTKHFCQHAPIWLGARLFCLTLDLLNERLQKLFHALIVDIAADGIVVAPLSAGPSLPAIGTIGSDRLAVAAAQRPNLRIDKGYEVQPMSQQSALF
ncbi:hypothetical protein H6F59_18040 [Nodosilinea sp. FACHB-141]|nr:hypothetical protein [Nodosilinea sp. FACHB-141]MBD2113727.1 hypothetical protein [Nodosilinea sp. FACHB-141]